MLKHVTFIVLFALFFTSAFGHTGVCGTQHPSRLSHVGAGAKVAASSDCFSTVCDDPANRDLYTLKGDSTLYTLRLNVIYFGNPSSAELSALEQQLDYLRSTYIAQAKLNFTVTTQIVTSGSFLSTNSEDDVTHRQVAKSYYKEGQLTILITTFSDNTGDIITAGYTVLPQSLLTDYSRYYMILDHNYAISPTGNTLLHEMGHAFGLLHTFTNTESCDLLCDEMVNSPDLNVVGDFCSDTKPVSLTFSCDTLRDSTDCKNTLYGPIDTLPQDNYMSYTPDDCQDRFTSQQVARMRCYVTAMPHLSSSVVDYVAPPFAVKQPVSSATQICVGVSALAIAAMLLF
jgi:hypothetical protein